MCYSIITSKRDIGTEVTKQFITSHSYFLSRIK
nr:MAG TPA: hypothetical protein [Caudoviricetes sp.]